MNRRKIVLCCAFAGLIGLFLIANREAYHSYFDGDDFATLSWARYMSAKQLTCALVTPSAVENSFRAVGAAMYTVLHNTVGLDFPAYVITIHGLHFIAIAVVWLLLRRLGFADLEAAAGTLLFAFHAAAFDVYWKPAFVFDLLCGLFCALAMWLYLKDRWIAALIAFWLAYKSKEIAVMLPFVLIAWECLLGQRRWKRLLPFFAISALLVGQAVALRQGAGTAYEFHFTPHALATTARFYASRVFLIPYAGFALLIIPLVARSRRTWFGVLTFVLFLAPLLFLPGRTFATYLYTPLIGFAIVGASLLRTRNIAALFFVLWIPWNYAVFRRECRKELQAASDRRDYFNILTVFHRAHGSLNAFVYEGTPESLHPFGAEGAVHLLDPKATVYDPGDPQVRNAVLKGAVAVLRWDAPSRRLVISVDSANTANVAYYVVGSNAPITQLRDGWYGEAGGIRWTKPHATAILDRPAGAKTFELRAVLPGSVFRRSKNVLLRVSLNGARLEDRVITKEGIYDFEWPLHDHQSGPEIVDIEVSPPYYPNSDGSNVLGIAIQGFGFKQ